MFRIRLTCEGIPASSWPQACDDIAEEFSHRPWHKIIQCGWDGDMLFLVADNDYDADGEAMAGEFSDTVGACTPIKFGYRIRIVSAVAIT